MTNEDVIEKGANMIDLLLTIAFIVCAPLIMLFMIVASIIRGKH